MKTTVSIFTFLFFLLSWWWYVCPHKQVCPFGKYASSTPATIDTEGPATSGDRDTMTMTKITRNEPLLFNWSDTAILMGPGFPAYRDSISGLLGQDDKLEILGRYLANEENPTSFSNLGLARAYQLRKLFPNLDADHIVLKDQLLRDSLLEGDPYPAFSLRRIINNASVREIEGRMIINFPHASNQMLENEALNAYLQDLVQHLSKTKAKVHLVGHTDSSAGAARNQRLGQMRADAIKNLLVRKGLDTSRVMASSQGENQPIADNGTEQGRRANRRVELTIID